MDRKTILHEFHYKEEEGGYCVASWGVRKKVRCRWRRVCEENDSEAVPSSSSEEEEEVGGELASCCSERGRNVTTTTTEVSVDNDEDEDRSAALLSNADLNDINNEEEDMEQGEEEVDDDDNNWWDYSSDESDDSSDEDYISFSSTKKRARKMHPCDATTAIFGTTIITKGGIYERYNGAGNDDRWIIQIVEFTGKKLPIRKARCRIIFHMHSAIRECFPNAESSAARRSSSSDDDDGDAVQIDRSIVMEETVKGTEFLKTLVASDEDFDVLTRLVEFDLKRDRSNKLIAQFSRRQRSNDPMTGAAAGQSLHVEEDARERTNLKPKELVLFAGIGGCSIGDEQAGFNCKWLVDKDHLAAASLRQCHPKATIYDEDVGAFLDKCMEQQPGYPKRGEVDHIQCSSPCNGFSRMNIYGGRNDHKNNILCHELVRATKMLLPKTGMFENVTGMLDASNVHHIIKIVQDLIRLKYQVRIAVLNSIDYGVPQKRKRVIITLVRADMTLPCMPPPSHDGDSFATLGDAILDMRGIECEMERHRSGLVQLPNGNFTFNHVARVARKDSKALDLDEPVACITTKNSFKHPLTTANRTLSIREYARLFGFPDSVQFFGSYTDIRKHIGNAVPVPLARAISLPIRLVHEGASLRNDSDSMGS